MQRHLAQRGDLAGAIFETSRFDSIGETVQLSRILAEFCVRTVRTVRSIEFQAVSADGRADGRPLRAITMVRESGPKPWSVHNRQQHSRAAR